MKGYIALANNDWCEYQIKNKRSMAVFWRKRLTFKAIDIGEPFFFLNRKRINNTRHVVGYGFLQSVSKINVNDAWDKFGGLLGSFSKQEFRKAIEDCYYSSSIDIGCIVLQNVTFTINPVSLESCNIVFSESTVSGKTITEEECKILLDKLNR